MKIQELFEKKLNMPVSSKLTSGILRNRNLGHLGTGVQAIAYYHNKFPDKVVKMITVEGPNDPSYQFLRLCINHPDNPYFPKIYAYKQYNTSKSLNDELTGEDRDRQYEEVNPTDSPPEWAPHQILVVMEKLHTIKANEPLATRLLQNCGILPNNLFDLKKYKLLSNSPLAATKIPFEDDNSRKELYQNTTDPQLKKALRLLEPLFKKFYPDLRPQNIMLRKTGGTHIVIVDPVC